MDNLETLCHQRAVASPDKSQENEFFDNLPKLLRPDQVASLLSISVTTIYDWKYRQKQRRVPTNLFLKFNRKLYLRSSVLRQWITSQNPSIEI